eukprot:scaffold59416_cov40-Prasinocladus_malaysianus.AAC.1
MSSRQYIEPCASIGCCVALAGSAQAALVSRLCVLPGPVQNPCVFAAPEPAAREGGSKPICEDRPTPPCPFALLCRAMRSASQSVDSWSEAWRGSVLPDGTLFAMPSLEAAAGGLHMGALANCF